MGIHPNHFNIFPTGSYRKEFYEGRNVWAAVRRRIPGTEGFQLFHRKLKGKEEKEDQKKAERYKAGKMV